ncbi:MAG: PIN domain-containing protein [Luteitalea sp.]|nr:PIN domain-containing protein [Luteitalea sp.]
MLIWVTPSSVIMLVDTGAWYAIADDSDRHHEEARRFYLARAPEGRLRTTDLIVAESVALISSHLSRAAALTFWETLRVTRTPILTLEAVDLEAAWHIAQAFSDQAFSFVDCTTFAWMERVGIHDAFAFDSHFLVYRFGPGRQRAFRRFP